MSEPYYSDEWVTIWHGDCRDVLTSLELEHVELLATDPPYAISTDKSFSKLGTGGTRNLDFFEGDRDWSAMTDGVLERLHLALTLSPASFYAWCGHRQFGLIVALLEGAGYRTRPLAWVKECPIPAPPGVGFDSALELCVYASRSGRKWVPPTGTKCPNVIVADGYRHGQPGKVDHPTQKPLATFSLPISYSTEPGDLVLDPFMGSGTSLRVAKDLGRRAIGIEVEERFCEVAAKRMGQEVLDLGGVA